MSEKTQVKSTAKTVEFETYYFQDLKPLIWFTQRLGGNLPESEDAAQDAMKSLWQHWDKVENPAAYTRQAVRRVLFRAHGKAKQAREAETMLRASESVGLADDDSSNADVQSVVAMLQALPKAQREVFALHMDGWDAGEIAQITEQKPATVRSNLRHARQKLTHMLENQDINTTRKEANDGP